ncbi:Proton-dependent Oligopeptide Transporter [Phytophthora cinnamomi]|uniref:Proton-dependent Oligopeptide Transporter n=1 Tax=Phytophthora cinnamomi TaxID=4785 RepID=UPI00355ABDC7|nr:Proton-dependent Oligopeptide Transporter [Phytophthora cinnamomi]
MRKSSEPRSPLTPQSLTPVVTAGYSTKLWDARAPKYSKNVMKSVCIFLLALTFCEELSGYGVNQSLKNFFQKLGWSNKGSNSMKLTYDSLSQFACIAAAFIADQYLGKYKTLLGAASFSSVGFVLIMIAALPSVLENQMMSKVIFCVGLFLGIALNQVDDGEVGHNISYVCGVLIVVATALWVYYAQDPSFIDGAIDSDGVEFDRELIEGVKQVILILPFNAFNTFWWVCQNQRGNNQTIIQQTDLRLGHSPDSTQIPAPTVQFFNPGPGVLLVPFFDLVIYPLYEKYAGKPPSVYGKVVAGYVVAIIAMVWTGVFEIIRRGLPVLTYVDAEGVTQIILNKNGREPMNNIPWYAAIPQYVLVSTATVLIQIPTYNVGYDKVPMGLRSVTIALGLFINSMGSTLLSVIVLLFGKFIPANLNDGHLEYMYFAIAAVMVINTIAYVVVMQKMQFGMVSQLGKESTEEGGKEVSVSKFFIGRPSINN